MTLLLPPTDPHPVVVVTGANSGVGFGICHRLLIHLSRSSPDDAFPRLSRKEMPISQPSKPSPFTTAKQLTLILACRNPERAAAARQHLFDLIDAEVSRQKKSLVKDGCAEELRRGLRIDFIQLNLTSMESIFGFAEEVSRRYSYITHLILNAGMLYATGLDWLTVFRQLLTEPVVALTTPRYLTQKIAAESPDGLGLVWQSNVFGHYSLLRLLEPLLLRNPYLDSRVEWLSSLDALPEEYDPTDPQLRRAKFSYQASKYQVDLLCTTLARAASQGSPPNGMAHIRHLLVQPGVCSTSMVESILGVFMEVLMVLMLYLARLLGSKNHPIRPYKGASAALYAALAPRALLEGKPGDPPQKYGSRTTLWGKDYVGMDPIFEWDENVKTGENVLEHCEKFFTMFEQRRGTSSSLTTVDSGVVVT